jgi:[acyl-carrier-protein] S-malonyltransferase
MAAVIGAEDTLVEEVCNEVADVVVPANYNSPGQLVISGSVSGIEKACKLLAERGVKRTVILNVGGAFHSPLMEPARQKLALAIEQTPFSEPVCPIYQNVTALPETNPEKIKQNLISQLTGAVKWKQSVERMVQDGATEFIEVGPGKVLQSLVKKIHREAEIKSI